MFSALDTQITFLLSSVLPHFPIFDSIFRTLSFEGATTIMWIAVVLIVFCWEFYMRNHRYVFLAQLTKLCIILAVTLAIAGGSVHYFIKPIFQRVRPYVQYQVTAPYCPKDFSFPSGHATVAFAGAYIISRFDHDRRRRALYVLLALSVSYSRIYLLCHYVGDVGAGAIYGLFVATLTYEVIHWMYARYHTKTLNS